VVIERASSSVARISSDSAQDEPATWTDFITCTCRQVVDHFVLGIAVLVALRVVDGMVVAPDTMCVHTRIYALLQLSQGNTTASKTVAGGCKVAHDGDKAEMMGHVS
jgi:hypothetical protein